VYFEQQLMHEAEALGVNLASKEIDTSRIAARLRKTCDQA
jgi:hypothetical protein